MKGFAYKIVTAIIALIVAVTIFGGLVGEYRAAAYQLSDNVSCADDGGVWNTTSEICMVSALNHSLKTFTSIPFSGLFRGNSVMMLIMMTGLVVTGIMLFRKK